MTLEQAGKAAGTVVEALKAQPLLLVVVVLNVVMLGMIFLIVRESQENHAALLQLTISKCLPTQP